MNVTISASCSIAPDSLRSESIGRLLPTPVLLSTPLFTCESAITGIFNSLAIPFNDREIVAHRDRFEAKDYKLTEEVMKKASSTEKTYLKQLQNLFKSDSNYNEAVSQAVSDALKSIFGKYPKKFLANTSKELGVYVDRKKALFSTWYEFFPRSASQKNDVHGTFKDCEKLLPRVAEMGFDTLYFPPVHPIGEVNRKGKNNTKISNKVRLF